MNNIDKKESIVSFRNVSVSFKEVHILKDLSFDIYPGEIVTIAGPSGSGKSTILKILGKIIQIDSGEIKVNAQRLGMAFQKSALFNSMTIWNNLALALEETTNLNKKKINKKVKEALEMVSLSYTENMYPDELSGGMQKRISIARALAVSPEIILYDEPSTGLDPGTASKLENDMLKLRDKTGVTSVVVTHDLETIKKVSDRVLVLYDGKIRWEGVIENFMTDESPYPRSFRERCSIEDLLNSD
ncbi:MAG: ATP-binding cassette domain-containing protein [bacterium]